ncbi:hypothetical protein [Micromonospora aurantiaca (nom. illeg.)]|uniref:hypothetical protein n=1 Tax=Micromonospora aurantiaca (nom. illeg.) TaxID=47850 RepID=UPI0011A4B08C
MTQQSIPPPLPAGTIRLAEQTALETQPAVCDRHPSATALVMVESPWFAGRPYGTRADGPKRQLTLCGHCYERHALVLDVGGWSVVADTRPRLYAEEDARRRGCAR